MADVLKNPSTPGWGAVAGVVGLFLAQITGVTGDLSGKPSAYEARLNEQLIDHSARIERNWSQINADKENHNRRMETWDQRLNTVERMTDRSFDRMEALRAAVDGLSASSAGLTDQMRSLAQVVAVMDNRIATMAENMRKDRVSNGQP